MTQRQSTNRLVIGDPRLAQAVELLMRNLGRLQSMEQIARTVGISRKTLYSLFLAELHQHPAAFVRQRRLALARTLLEESRDKIGGIAEQCGMSLNTLIRQFTATFGQTPHQWRSQSGSDGARLF